MTSGMVKLRRILRPISESGHEKHVASGLGWPFVMGIFMNVSAERSREAAVVMKRILF